MHAEECAVLKGAERARLQVRAGLAPPPSPYRRPSERPFTADERDGVTILHGGLTSVHDRLITSVLRSAGYRALHLPTPDLDAFQLGRHYGSVGLCNPAHFTVGNLIKYLLRLEAAGLTRQQIVDRYVFFTSGTCGPCRFGMYEAEYRFALKNAGFDGFRILTFRQNDGVNATSGEPGLKFSVHFGMSALNAFNCADVLNDAARRLRPYEVRAGDTDRAVDDIVESIQRWLRGMRPADCVDRAPDWLRPAHPRILGMATTIARILQHLLRKQYVYDYLVFLNINICRNNLEDVRQLTEFAHEHRIATDYHINETPMLAQDGHFKHLAENPTYIRPEDWRDVDALIDWLVEKTTAGYQMVNSVRRLLEMKTFLRMSSKADLKTCGWNGDGTGHVADLAAAPGMILAENGTLQFADWNCRAGQNNIIIRPDGTLAPCSPLFDATLDWGRIEEPKFERKQLGEMKATCQRHCFSTLNHTLAHCYDDGRVIRWVWKQARNRFQGGVQAFED